MATNSYDKLESILNGVEVIPVEPDEDINKKIKEVKEEKLSSNIDFGEGDSSDIYIDFEDNEDEDDVIGDSFNKPQVVTEEEKEALSTGIISFGKSKSTLKTITGVIFEEEEIVLEEDLDILEEEAISEMLEEEGIAVVNLKDNSDIEISESPEEKFEEIKEKAQEEMSGLRGLMDNIKSKMTEEELVKIKDKSDDDFYEYATPTEPDNDEKIAVTEDKVEDITNIVSLEPEIIDFKEEPENIDNELSVKETEELIIDDWKRECYELGDEGDIEAIEELSKSVNESIEEMESTLNEYSLGEERAKIDINDLTLQLLNENKNKVSQGLVEVNNEEIKNLENSLKETKVNRLDLDGIFGSMAEELDDILTLGKAGVEIKKNLLLNLVGSGKRYIEHDYTTKDYLGENIYIHEEKSVGEKQLYYYKDIPEDYTGYRTVFKKMIEEIKKGITEKVVMGEICYVDMIDRDYGIEKLTKSETFKILEFLKNNKISCKLSKGILQIYLEVSEE